MTPEEAYRLKEECRKIGGELIKIKVKIEPGENCRPEHLLEIGSALSEFLKEMFPAALPTDSRIYRLIWVHDVKFGREYEYEFCVLERKGLDHVGELLK